MGNIRACARPAFVFGATLALTLGAASCLPITNVFDPSGPPDSLALTFVNGSLAFDDGAPLDGVVVDIYREGGGDAGGGERVTASFVASDGRDAFSFEVAPDVTRVVIQPNRCGYADISIDIPDAYPEYAANLTPGSEFDINDGRPVVLRRDPPSRTVTGRVEALDETASESGIKVSLVEVGTDGACREAIAEVTTDETGAFSLSPIADGRYVAVAFTEGTTVAISDVVDSCAFATGADGTVPDVEIPLLSIRGGSGALALTASSTDNPDLPAGVIAEPRVNVLIGGFFEWADEMRLSEDPTFASGSTGWVPVQSPRLYPSVGQLQGNTQTTVFGQFRSSCALSPLYSASVIYDGEAPDVFRVRVRDVEADGNVGGELVVILGEATVPLAVDGYDEIDVRVVAQVTPIAQLGEEPDMLEVPPPQTFVVEGGAGFSLREQVDIPLDERRYTLSIDVLDVAGNAAVLSPYLFEVIRDTEPPTTPLPSVTQMEISGDIAYVWLEERDCERTLPNGDEQRYRALVCEENPRRYKFFEVRGGPVLLDFTGFDQPPFVVPVFKDDETEIEIRAVDDAGNPSESLGRVTVLHQSKRELMRLPADRTLGPARAPTLVASGGMGFFATSPRHEVNTDEVFTYLVAQPSWAPEVGLELATTPDTKLLRKLSAGGCSFGACPIDARTASALSGRSGALSWTEELDLSGFGSTALNTFLALPDATGVPILRDAVVGSAFTSAYGEDADGDIVANDEFCDRFGLTDCRKTGSWVGAFEAPLGAGVVGNTLLLTRGTGSDLRPLFDDSDTLVETRQVTGPALLLTHFLAPDLISRLRGVRIELQADPGTPLVPALFVWDDSNDEWDQRGLLSGNPSVVPATGTGVEELPLVEDIFASVPSSGQVEGYLAGVLVPAGASVDVPLYAYAGPEPNPPLIEHASPLGVIELPLSAPSLPLSLPSADLAALDADRLPRLWVMRSDRDGLREGLSGGVTVVPLTAEGELPLSRVSVPLDEQDAAPIEWIALAENKVVSRQLTAEPTSVEQPTSCAVVFEVDTTTDLRDVRVGGSGTLDDINFGLFRSSDGTPAGLFEPYNLQGPPPSSGYPSVGDHIGGLATEGAPSLACEALPGQTVFSDSLSATVPGAVLEFDTLTGTRPAPANSYADTFGFANVPELIDVVTVVEGQEYKIGLRDDGSGFGDLDLYVGLGYAPDNNTYDCRPYLIGNNEDCYVVVPPGVTQMHLYGRGYEAANPFTLAVSELAVVDTRAVGATQQLYYQLSSNQSDLEARIGIDRTPTWTDFDDYMNEDFDYAFLSEATAFSAEVALGGLQALNWLLYYEVTDGTPTDIGSYAVTPGQVITANIHSDADPQLLLRFGAPPTLDDYDCLDVTSGSSSCGGFGGIVVPAGVDTMYLAVRPDALSADVTVDIEVAEAGCDAVTGIPLGSISNVSATLTPGVYIATLSENYNTPLTFADEGTAFVEVGSPAIASPDGPVNILGAVVNGVEIGNDLAIGGYSSTGNTCAMELKTTTPSRITAMDIADTYAVAALESPPFVEGARATLFAADLAARGGQFAPLATDLPADHLVWAVRTEQDGAWVLSALPSGAAPTLWRVARDDGAATLTGALDALGLPLQISTAAIDDGRLVIAGSSSVGPQQRVYALDDETDPPSVELLLTEALSDVPVTISLDREDLFTWEGGVGTERLMHRDLRDVTPLYSGGQFETVGFDVRETQVAFAVLTSGDTTSGKVILLNDQPGSTDLAPVEIDDRRPHTHVALVGENQVATLTEIDGARRLVLHDVVVNDGEDAVDVPDTTVVINSADASLAGLDGVASYDPLPSAQTASLKIAGNTLALLGKDAGGAVVLTVFDLTGPAGWEGLAPSFGPEPVGGDPVALFTDHDAVVVTRFDGSALVVAREPGGPWTPEPEFPSEVARIVALADGQLVLLETLSTSSNKPPQTLAVGLASPTALAIDTAADGGVADGGAAAAGIQWRGRLASGTLGHAFASAMMQADRLLLFDSSGTSPILWGIQLDGTRYGVSEGPHRPLVTGNEAIGTQAAPKAGPGGIYWVKRGQSGNALMRMRR